MDDKVCFIEIISFRRISATLDPSSLKNITFSQLRSFDDGEELEFDLERRVVTHLGTFGNGEFKLKWQARNVTGPGGRYIKGVHGYKIRPEMIDEYYAQ